ncbi:MAG: LysM peptidoglycan-binding domain-containing protein, partial [Myxococcota bacterium]|nr:LysM peptidoglycan-binding domain-containing protein [Myxococcota bacterium]
HHLPWLTASRPRPVPSGPPVFPDKNMQANSPLAFDELPRGAGGTGATAQIHQVLNDSDLDVPTSLYDEALAYAREGRLAPAAERLRMLLVLDPTDANAALLLGKVQAGRGQWQEALAHLDNAAAQGAPMPGGLREEVEVNLRRQVQDAEQHRKRVAAREQAEIRGLRQEAKRLRSDNAALELQAEELGRRVKLWTSVTALVAGSASALLLAVMLFGTSSGAVADDVAGMPSAEPAATPVPIATVPVSPPVDGTPVGAPADIPTAAPVEIVTVGAEVVPAAPAPPTVVAEPITTLPTVHVVRKGQTLGHIAREHYGKSSEWKRILKANDAILKGSVKRLQPGMELVVPAL